MINLDDPRLAYEATLELLLRHPDLVAIYDAGGGREGIIQAIAEAGSERRITVICNELTPTTRLALISRTITCVLSLPVPIFAAATIAEMLSVLAGRRANNSSRLLPFEIYFAENLM